jgi:hypothetical protein
MTIDEQIEQLQQQIYALNEQKQKSVRATILPFLQKHAKLEWGGWSGRFDVEFETEELEEEAYKILQAASGDGSGYHIHVEIATHTYFNYDDGRLTLSIPAGGNRDQIMEKVYEQTKPYGIKISFDTAISNAQRQVALKQMDLDRLLKLKAKDESQS